MTSLFIVRSCSFFFQNDCFLISFSEIYSFYNEFIAFLFYTFFVSILSRCLTMYQSETIQVNPEQLDVITVEGDRGTL